MAEDVFKILIDRLKGGVTQKIEETLSPSFLEINETELQFPEAVSVKGEAYVTDTHLIVHLKTKARAFMPCAICNEMTPVSLQVDNFYHTQLLEEIPSAVFDFREPLREALLIELPKYAECNLGNCPQRALLTPYLRSEVRADNTTYLPFADMGDTDAK